MSTFHLEITVPDRAFYSSDAEELVVQTPGGEIGILPGHIPMVASVSSGILKIKKADRWIYAFVSEGFLEVTQKQTSVLADSAEWPEEIDLERAKAAEEKARKRIGARPPAAEEDLNLQAALQRAIWRQKASEKSNP